jgi:hypothetical protein
MVLLIFSELAEYLKVTTQTEMYVDVNRGWDKLTINLDVTFSKFPCGILSLDAQDVIGTHLVKLEGNMLKTRLTAEGTSIGDEDALTDSYRVDIEGIKRQLDRKEGCRLHGHVKVNKVPGNLHVSSHAYHEFIHSIIEGDYSLLDLSHQITALSFGEEADLSAIRLTFSEGVLSPLDELFKEKSSGEARSYEYYLKVVPTTFKLLDSHEYFVHQFTADTHEYRPRGLPAVFFRYDLSPVTVKYAQSQASLASFLVEVCAVVGGVFAVARAVESVIFAAVSQQKSSQKLG